MCHVNSTLCGRGEKDKGEGSGGSENPLHWRRWARKSVSLAGSQGACPVRGKAAAA